MGNSETKATYNLYSKSDLTQSTGATPTYYKGDKRRFSSANLYRQRSKSFNDWPEMSKRRLSNWRSSQRRQKAEAHWVALEKEKRLTEERDRLFSAITNGDEDMVVRMITRHSMDVNASDENHLTALHYAAMYMRPELITLLIENGANPNAYDMKGGFTPAHWVVINSNPGMSDVKRIGDCLEALVRGGCDINSKDFNQATPLHFAARKDDKMVVDALMRLGANPNDIDVLGRTCASVAKSEATKILIIKLADLRARAIYHVLEVPPSV